MKNCIVMLIAVLFISCSNPTDGTNGIDGKPGPMGPPGENAITVYNSNDDPVGTLFAGMYVVTGDGNVIRIGVSNTAMSPVSLNIYSDKNSFDDVGAKFAARLEILPGHTEYTRYIYNASGRVFTPKDNTILSSYTAATRLQDLDGTSIPSTITAADYHLVEVEEVAAPSIPQSISDIINYQPLTF